MAVYLEEEERELLLLALTAHRANKPWVLDRVVEKIKSDAQRLEDIKVCEHNVGVYTGSKTCCTKCGQLLEETWELENEL